MDACGGTGDVSDAGAFPESVDSGASAEATIAPVCDAGASEASSPAGSTLTEEFAVPVSEGGNSGGPLSDTGAAPGTDPTCATSEAENSSPAHAIVNPVAIDSRRIDAASKRGPSRVQRLPSLLRFILLSIHPSASLNQCSFVYGPIDANMMFDWNA